MGIVIRLAFSVDIKLLPPGYCLPLPQGYIHVSNHEKNCIKSDFKEISLKLATFGWSDKAFLLTSKFWNLQQMGIVIRLAFSVDIKLLPPGYCLPQPQGYIYVLNHEKIVKIRLQRDMFETCNKWPKWQNVLVDIKILSPRGCLSLPRGYIHV